MYNGHQYMHALPAYAAAAAAASNGSYASYPSHYAQPAMHSAATAAAATHPPTHHHHHHIYAANTTQQVFANNVNFSNGHSRSGSTSSSSSSSSTHSSQASMAAAVQQQQKQQQQQQTLQQQHYHTTTQHYSQLVQHTNFINERSPFHQVVRRCCVMPIFAQKRIQFRISLSREDLALMQRSKDKAKHKHNTDNSSNKHELHLRLFNVTTYQHQEWNTSQCEVCINTRKSLIERKSTRTGVKKKGHHIVAPLNITADAGDTMDFEITSNGNFAGVAVIEIVRVFTVDQIATRIQAKFAPVDGGSGGSGGSRHDKTKKCAICDKSNDLLRCSRCKNVWYCGTTHQARDWQFHQTVCIPSEQKAKLQPVTFKSEDDDVVCGETKVSLRCPLSICRIQTPVRGSECTHPQCVDLRTFLGYSHTTGVWQCPVCLKPLQFAQIVIDNDMKNILHKTSDDIDLVRLFPDGSFKEITLEEQREEDARAQTVTARKRKRNEDDTTTTTTTRKQTSTDKEASTSTPAQNDNQNDTNNKGPLNLIVLD